MPLSTVSIEDGSLVIAWAFSVPVDVVWTGLTDPALLSQWLGQPIEWDIRAGGRLLIDHGEGYRCRSDVTEADAPHRLDMSWKFPDEPESRLRIELRASGTGATAELAHDNLGELVGSYGPGWITHLTFLEAAAEGVPISTSHFWTLHSTFESLCTGRTGTLSG